MKILILILLIFAFAAFIPGGNSLAYASTTSSSGDSGTTIPSFNLNSLPNPMDFLNSIQSSSFLQGIKNFLPSGLTGDNSGNSSSISNLHFSTSDIPGSLKSIAILAINLFLIVINTVAGILKALLPFLGK